MLSNLYFIDFELFYIHNSLSLTNIRQWKKKELRFSYFCNNIDKNWYDINTLIWRIDIILYPQQWILSKSINYITSLN